MRIVLIACLGAAALTWLTAITFAQVSPPSAAAATPENVFKEKGLTKVGFLLVIPQEAALHADANSVRGLKTKVGAETSARSNLGRAVQKASDDVVDLESQLAELSNRMAKLKKKPNEYNALVDPYNQIVVRCRERKADLAEMKKKLGKIDDSQMAYGDALTAALKKADAAAALYDGLAHDSVLTAAITRYNSGATQALKLGPSGNFSNDVAFLKKCLSDMVAEGVPVRMDNGVPVLAVTINGVTHDMIWDSGASAVSLSAETAAEFGLHATSHDRTIVLTVADGRKVENKLIVVPSIRVGMFTAENVECVIAPAGKIRGPDLLGGTFQRHFLCRLDQAAGVLHLTPNDKQASTDRTAVAAAPPAMPPAAAPTDPAPPKSIPAPAPAPAPTPAPAPAPVPVPNAPSPVAPARPPVAVVAREPVDLLALVDIHRDAVGGGWTVEPGGGIKTDGKAKPDDRLQVPYEPPEEYDFLIEFRRLKGRDVVFQVFPIGDSTLTWTMGARAKQMKFEAQSRHFPNVDDPSCTDGDTSFTSLVKVRRDGVEALLNGKRIAEYRGSLSDLHASDQFVLPSGRTLGIGSWHKAPTLFTKIRLIPVTGTGRVAIPAGPHADVPTAPSPPTTQPGHGVFDAPGER